MTLTPFSRSRGPKADNFSAAAEHFLVSTVSPETIN